MMTDSIAINKTNEPNTINYEVDSILANLLATENIILKYDNVSTASFDLVNRVLRIPHLSNLHEDEKFLWLIHEIGHAIFTPPDTYINFPRKPYLSPSEEIVYTDILNVLEDYRIEKLIKEKYRGAGKILLKGRKKLFEREEFSRYFNENFFLSSETNLIDKLNIYIKAYGISVFRIPKELQPWIDKLNKIKNFNDVLVLADEIFDFLKKEYESKNQNLEIILPDTENNNNQKNEENNETLAFSEQTKSSSSEKTDEEENDGKTEIKETLSGKKSTDQNISTEKLDESEHQFSSGLSSKTLREEKKKTTQQNNDQIFINVYIDEYNFEDYLIDSNTFIEKTINFSKSNFDLSSFSQSVKRIWERDNKFIKAKTDLYVQEFSLKRNARNFANESFFLSGELDENLLYSYKTNEHIFKYDIIQSNQKNHGLVFFFDLSNSIHGSLPVLALKMLSFINFCEKSNIPFTVFGFSNSISYIMDTKYNKNISNYVSKPNCNDYKNYDANSKRFAGNFCLIKLFYSNQPIKEKQIIYYILKNRFVHLRETPLFQTKLCVPSIFKYYKKLWGTEKIHFIFLTDGDDTASLQFMDYDEKIFPVIYYNKRKNPIILNIDTSKEITKSDVFQMYMNTLIRYNIDKNSKLLFVFINHCNNVFEFSTNKNLYDIYVNISYLNFFENMKKICKNTIKTNKIFDPQKRKISNFIIKKIIDIIA